MSSKAPRLRSANDLPDELVKQHRVMFARGNADGSMDVVTDQMTAGLAEKLSQVLPFAVHVHAVDAYPDQTVRDVYPMIMAECGVAKQQVKDVLSPPRSSTTKRGEKSGDPKTT